MPAEVTAIKHVDDLPRTKHRDDWTVTHGYAVELSGHDHPQAWFFFYHLEPAWLFLRTARMGEALEGEIYQAANEVRFHDHGQFLAKPGDRRTIYVGQPITYWKVDESKLVAYFAGNQIKPTSKGVQAPSQPLTAYLAGDSHVSLLPHRYRVAHSGGRRRRRAPTARLRTTPPRRARARPANRRE
jgi:hypothetical protein